MTPEIKWSELSERERDALVDETVLGRTGRDWFKPSTSISDAMAVVEKMRPSHFVLINGADTFWSVEFEPTITPKPFKTYEAACASLPEAICLAALRSTGLNISEV